MKTSITILPLAAALALTCNAQVISVDSFDLPAGTTGQEFDLQLNQTNRQSAGSVNLTYSDRSAAVGANTQVYLNQDFAYDNTGVMWLRNYYNAAGSYQIGAAAVDINEDLSSQLAGTSYTVSYSGKMSDYNGNIVGQSYVDSWYQGFALGGSTLYEPANANSDLGFSIYQNNVATIHTDGTLRWAGTVPGLSVGSVYDVQIDVDEAAGTASISMDVGGTVTDLGTYPVDFEAGDTTRELLFNNRLATFDTYSAGDGMVIADAQINDFQITVIPSETGSGGAFSISNGYFNVSGSDGLVTEISLDQSGTGSYDVNTIKPGSYSAFTVDGMLLESTNAAYTLDGDTLTVSGLPDDNALIIELDGDTMNWTVVYAGTKDVQHEWIFDFLAEGFYNRATGSNTSPTAYIDMPFESFYSRVGQQKSFWPVEAFKSYATYGPRGSLGPVLCRARADRDDSVFMDASALGTTQGQAESDNLRLITGPQSRTSSASVSFQVQPKTYAATVDGSPIPEFYVEPDVSISPLSDPSTTYSASELLTEFYQHTLFWWGANGGIWSDWMMQSSGMMDRDSWYVQHLRNSLLGWIIATDGSSTSNNFAYAFTWGGRRGWPFEIYDHLDNRHFNNNAIFITALWRYVMWTGDTNFLYTGSNDLDVRIGYADSTQEIPSQGSTPFHSVFDDTNNYDEYLPLGQTFTATKPFTAVAIHTPTWGETGSGLTLTLYQGEGSDGTQIAQSSFSNVADNGWPELTFAQQPAGVYYVEMTDPVGTIAWWGHENAPGEDVNPTGEGYFGGGPKGDMLTRARALMQYQQTKLGGAEHHLITLGPAVSDHHQGRGYYRTGGIVDVQGNWYDMLPFGYQDLFANINYYESLRAMADLEALAGNTAKANEYREQMPLTKSAFSNALYRSGLDAGSGISASRFIACKDVDGVDHDFGYAGLNAWAVAVGLASKQQAEAIYNWMDNGKSLGRYGTWTADIYDKFKFGPRGSTIYNNTDHGSESWWRWETAGWNIIQNGGTSLHESGFDIEARAKHLGGDNAWNRMSTILARYADPDRMCMDEGYYGEIVQGGRPDGSWWHGNVGWMYAEFPETALAGASFFNGFFGVELSTRGLRIEPSIPTNSGITTIGARNIHYQGARFDLEATSDSITFTCTSNPDNQTFYMTGSYSNTGTFTRTAPLDKGAAILSDQPQTGIEEMSLSFSGSPAASFSLDATFEGTTLSQYVLQSTDNLLSNQWNTISLPFAANTSIVIEPTNTHEFFRAMEVE